MGLIERRAPVRWNDLDFTEWSPPAVNPFSYLNTWLTPLGMDANQALLYFSIDYEEALTEYKETFIDNIIHMVAITNSKKYDKLIALYNATYDPLVNYDSHDDYTDTRTPNLTDSTQVYGSAGTTIQNKQTQTTKDKPGTYKATSIGYKDPYDGGNNNFHTETKTENSATGERSTEISFSGDPDQTNTTTQTTTTRTDTGTETVEHHGTKKGNIGTVSAQDLAEQEITLAEKMNIWKIIERDLAAKIFIAVWPKY